MSLITRREAVRASGLALTASFVGAWSSQAQTLSSQAQTLDAQTSNSGLSVSQSLVAYVNDGLSTSLRQFREGTLQPKHLISLSNKVHLYADHLDSLQVDQAVKRGIQLVNVSDLPLVIPSQATDSVTAVVKLHNPDLSAADFSIAPPTRQELLSAQSYISTTGSVGHCHNLADQLVVASIGMRFSRGAQTASGAALQIKPIWGHVSGLYRQAALDAGSRAHLMRVQSCAEHKPAICSQLAQWSNYSVGAILTLLGIACVPPILAAINVALPGIGGALDAACAAIAVNPLAAVNAIATIVSLVLAGVQLAIC